MAITSRDWFHLQHDADSGIESVHAHFRGHAYDVHDHDEALVGITLQGVQQFHCHRRLHRSTPGRVMLIEPGAVHDGHAPEQEDFTYAMLYLPQSWLLRMGEQLQLGRAFISGAMFRHTIANDDTLSHLIHQAFMALHVEKSRLARDQTLDAVLRRLAAHSHEVLQSTAQAPAAAWRACDALHADITADMGLDTLALQAGIDRFRLTREFKRAFGMSPHAYLVRLRLRTARGLLARGRPPGEVATEVGFADQSHLGRWFRRAYGLTPGAYQLQCTNVLDRPRDQREHGQLFLPS